MRKNPREITGVEQMIDAGNASGPRLSAVAQHLKRQNVTAVNKKMGTKGRKHKQIAMY